MGIKKHREAAGMSQQELAEKMKVTQSAVANWENGETRPRVDKLAEMAELFGCSMDELMSKEE